MRRLVPDPVRTVALFLVTSLVSFLAIILAGIGVASGVLAGNMGFAGSALPAFGAAVIVAAVAYFPGRLRRAAQPADGRAVRAVQRALAYLDDGVRWSGDLLRSRDPLLIFGALGYLAFDIAAIAAAFKAFGPGGLPLGTLVLAYTLGQAGAIIPVPGSSEAGLIGVFVLYGAPLALATSAVLLYRVFQAGIPAIVGLVGMADVRHLLHEAPPPEELAPALRGWTSRFRAIGDCGTPAPEEVPHAAESGYPRAVARGRAGGPHANRSTV